MYSRPNLSIVLVLIYDFRLVVYFIPQAHLFHSLSSFLVIYTLSITLSAIHSNDDERDSQPYLLLRMCSQYYFTWLIINMTFKMLLFDVTFVSYIHCLCRSLPPTSFHPSLSRSPNVTFLTGFFTSIFGQFIECASRFLSEYEGRYKIQILPLLSINNNRSIETTLIEAECVICVKLYNVQKASVYII